MMAMKTEVLIGGQGDAADRCWSLGSTQVCFLENNTRAMFALTNPKLGDVFRECGGFEGGLSLAPTAMESVIVSRSR